MRDYIKVFTGALGVLASVFILSCITGTILYLTFPAAQEMIPVLAKGKIIITNPTWTQWIVFSWFIATFINFFKRSKGE